MKTILASTLALASLLTISFMSLKGWQASASRRVQIEHSSPTPTPSPEPVIDITIDPNRVFVPEREPSFEERLNLSLGSDDVDCDGIKNINDNCIAVYNPDQKDSDRDGDGNVCDTDIKNSKKKDRRCDIDRDGIVDDNDNCPGVCNRDQKDTDKDGGGDACDSRLVNLATVKRMCNPSEVKSSSKTVKKPKSKCSKRH